MKFGVCCSPDQAQSLGDVGFDFFEWPVSSTVGTGSDADFAALTETVDLLPLVPEAWNVLLPGDLKVVGSEADPDALRVYAERSLARVRQLGGEVVVFGSGRSRNIPEDWPEDEAAGQFADACTMVAEIAAGIDLVIAFEPLRRDETNLINRVDEGLRLVERVDHAGFELLADLYHMAAENEPFSNLRAASPHLAHIHVAAPGSRGVPLDAEATSLLDSFLDELHTSAYDKRISFEGKWSEREELAEGLAIMRRLWASKGTGGAAQMRRD